MVSPLTMSLARRALDGTLGIPLLGICFGHQALGLAHGWKVVPSPLGAVHGLPCDVHHDGRHLFQGLASPARMVRYHSLVVQPPTADHGVASNLGASLDCGLGGGCR